MDKPNTAIKAMELLQKDLEGNSNESGLDSEDAINNLIEEIRYNSESLD